eukprot:TRINITY_DN9805_c0_g3_i1.p1 TRINITY_DN9805_c0_g3~~TRINITY_DN9805_c0_g3_i1.p1  ORF type:complete len:222 (+),score=53.06 TRINITY_DN9805_c0_g3_i1:71-736(+)
MFQPISTVTSSAATNPTARQLASSSRSTSPMNPLLEAVSRTKHAIPGQLLRSISMDEQRTTAGARSTSPKMPLPAVDRCRPVSKSCSSSPRPSRSSLQLRRSRTASLSISLPKTAIKNDEDTREETWTPEKLDDLFRDAADYGHAEATARHDPTATPSPTFSELDESTDSGVFLSPNSPFYPTSDMATPSPVDSDLEDDLASLGEDKLRCVMAAMQLDCSL